MCFHHLVTKNDRDTNRKYGYVPKGEFSKSKSIFLRGERYTGIMAMSMSGVLATRIIKGAANKEIFLDFFVKDVVRPPLSPSSACIALSRNTRSSIPNSSIPTPFRCLA